MNNKYLANKITVNISEQILTILWDDGHISNYPLDGLRRACPCVTCMGGHENMGKKVDPAIFLEEPQKYWEIKEISPIGNYAIQIYWSDGHNEGIYRWEALREMCPCEICQPLLYK